MCAARGIDIDLSRIPLDDKPRLRAPGAGRNGRRVPGGKAGHAPGAGRHAARPLRGHHRAGRALPPGSDGQHPDLLRAQARQRGARLYPSQARADPARDVRRHHLPGTGDADRPGARRLLARRSRSPAPRDGQEDPRRDGGAARALRLRRGRARRRARPGRDDLRAAANVSPTTASTRATRRPMRWSPIRPPT